ncbi:MAG: exodeoxyribonuclease VII large subunit, partial [Ignavibacteriaceae bacterium]|nr:exodeoxyribonuclease VII large subunit [Ignavibacteriaceae bacterium]
MFFDDDIYSVSDLTKEIKIVIEEGFSDIQVQGELSNFKAHVSGHWYFSLKDSDATINCTMWRGINNYVFFTPQDGMKVIVSGRITVYPPRGAYQIDVRSMKPAGVGELQAAFEALKAKLSKEGLFDEERKRPIPQMPLKIGVVTAIDGAAFKDMISVAKRRFPLVEIVIAPARVQGAGAASIVSEAIKKLNSETDIDVIIVARGGGSIEDLWCFNEEEVARAIFSSGIPVVTGIGHEIDFTIADFVADLRAPTPSAAMELCTPDQREIFVFINDFFYNASENILSTVNSSSERIYRILNSYGFRMPVDLIRQRSQQVDSFIFKIFQLIEKKIFINENKVSLLAGSIQSHDLQKTLKKGFVLVKQDGQFI